jgi:hypothetical protein
MNSKLKLVFPTRASGCDADRSALRIPAVCPGALRWFHVEGPVAKSWLMGIDISPVPPVGGQVNGRPQDP